MRFQQVMSSPEMLPPVDLPMPPKASQSPDPTECPVTPSMQLFSNLTSGDSALCSTVLPPKVMGIVVVHCHLLGMQLHCTDSYGSPLFGINQVVNPNENTYQPG